MKFCAQRGCQVPIKPSDVLCPCCQNPLADSGAAPVKAAPPAAPAAKTPARKTRR